MWWHHHAKTPATTVPAGRPAGKDALVGSGAPGTGVATEDGSVAVLTVVFTDIEGSTALTERLGDERWVEVLSAHDAAVRTALHNHGGLEVKTVGDGFMAVFPRAASAVWAGLEAQRLVGDLSVPELPGGLRLRVGGHTGRVIRRAGDVLGRNVHVARRIASEATAGQVLVSSSLKVLAQHDPGLEARSPRIVRLRGISEPQVVFVMGASAGGGAVHDLQHRRREGRRPAEARSHGAQPVEAADRRASQHG